MLSLTKALICAATLSGLSLANTEQSSVALVRRQINDRILHRRQASCEDANYYFTLVNTALFTVNYIDNTSHACDPNLIPQFNDQGLDGAYAVDIICVYDAGVQLFGSITLSDVSKYLMIALIGLFDAANKNGGSPARTLSCSNLNTDVLESAGLPSEIVQDIICGTGPCFTSTTPSSTRPALSSVTSLTSVDSSSIVPSGETTIISASSFGSGSSLNMVTASIPDNNTVTSLASVTTYTGWNSSSGAIPATSSVLGSLNNSGSSGASRTRIESSSRGRASAFEDASSGFIPTGTAAASITTSRKSSIKGSASGTVISSGIMIPTSLKSGTVNGSTLSAVRSDSGYAVSSRPTMSASSTVEAPSASPSSACVEDQGPRGYYGYYGPRPQRCSSSVSAV